MTVRGKLLRAMTAIIAIMGLLFIFLTLFVVGGIVGKFSANVDRDAEMKELAGHLAAYYEKHGSWDGVESVKAETMSWSRRPEAGYMLRSPGGGTLLLEGTRKAEELRRLGLSMPVKQGGETIGVLYYSDRQVAQARMVRTAVSSSVIVTLLFGSVLIVLIALVVAYWTSRRLTAPLQKLLQAIEELGRGKLGSQAEIVSRDEYGQVAAAFNRMSLTLERTETARRNVVADAAHELRTPLAILRSKLDLIQLNGKPVEPEKLLPIQDDLIRLTKLVDELHRLSMAEADLLALERRPVHVPDLLRRVADRLEEESGRKRIAVGIDNACSFSEIEGDADRLTQVFLNLLVNAVRYTPEGGRIDIRIAEVLADGRERMRIAVRDSGIGIAPEQLPYIFDRFYRGDEARARHTGGSGLGLAIVREYVRAHSGTVEVSSEPGRGTEFAVILPRTGE